MMSDNDTHIQRADTVCRVEAIVKRPVPIDATGLHHNAPTYDVVVSVTSLVRHVEMPPASNLFAFKVYHPAKYHQIQAMDILRPSTVFFGGGCWLEDDKDAVAEVVVVKPQIDWQNSFCQVSNGN